MSDMVETLVERVARAIMETSAGGCYVSDWREAEWNPHVEMALKQARAAIEAMRDPTTEMQWAGYRAKDAVFSADALWNRDPANCWNAMISAALETPNTIKNSIAGKP